MEPDIIVIDEIDPGAITVAPDRIDSDLINSVAQHYEVEIEPSEIA